MTDRVAGWRRSVEGQLHYVANPGQGPTAVCGADMTGAEPVAPADAIADRPAKCGLCRERLGAGPMDEIDRASDRTR